jgi:hypothetical protein
VLKTTDSCEDAPKSARVPAVPTTRREQPRQATRRRRMRRANRPTPPLRLFSRERHCESFPIAHSHPPAPLQYSNQPRMLIFPVLGRRSGTSRRFDRRHRTRWGHMTFRGFGISSFDPDRGDVLIHIPHPRPPEWNEPQIGSAPPYAMGPCDVPRVWHLIPTEPMY